MTVNIVVVGSVNTDLIVRAPRLPLGGETLTGSDFHTISGGKGANQAVAAARQGGAVSLVACIGDDDFGAQQRKSLGDRQVASFDLLDKLGKFVADNNHLRQ